MASLARRPLVQAVRNLKGLPGVCAPSILHNGSPLKSQSANITDMPLATYGGRHTVTLIPGHGIGPEMVKGVKEVFKTAGVPIDFEYADINPEEDYTFEDVVTSIKRNGVALKGNWVTEDKGLESLASQSKNVALRHQLDLYANVVKCKSFPTVKTRHNNVNLVIVRENTEGEYSHLEHENVSGVVEMFKIVTEDCSRRIAKFAFDYARAHNRKKVTSVHKANIMKLSDGLFLSVCREMSQDYPEIEFDNMIIDNCAMQMVSRPEQFDVMVMPNLYGNVITNIAAALVGGPGLPCGANYGDGKAIFEAGTRNSGKGMVGQNIANPMSMLFASTNMLRHIGLHQHAHLIDMSMHGIVTTGKARTADIGGSTSTSDFFAALNQEISTQRHRRRAQSQRM